MQHTDKKEFFKISTFTAIFVGLSSYFLYSSGFMIALGMAFSTWVLLLITYALWDIYENGFLGKYNDGEYHEWFAWYPVTFRKQPIGISEMTLGGKKITIWWRLVYRAKRENRYTSQGRWDYLTVEDYNDIAEGRYTSIYRS